jgi:very-short-patch-repair endonuclease
MSNEREIQFSSIGAIAAAVAHEANSRAMGVDGLQGHPGRAIDILNEGRSRLFIKPATDAGVSRVEREAAVWQRAQQEYAKGERLCDSPIERDLLAALLTTDWGYFATENAVVHDSKDHNEAFPASNVVIVPQMQIARYRLDFGLVLCRYHRRHIIAVECDGRDFHQLDRDNARDGYLVSFGIQTIRRTGSDIFTMPLRGATLIAESIQHWWEFDQ